MIKNLKISAKLMLGFGIVLVLMAAVSILSYTRMESMSKMMQKRDMYGRIAALIADARLDRNKYFFTTDNKFKENVYKSFDGITEIARSAMITYTSAADTDNLKDILASVEEYKTAFGEYAALVAEKEGLIVKLGESGGKAFQLSEASGSETILSNLLMMRVTTLKYIHETASDALEKDREAYYNKARQAAAYSSNANFDRNTFLSALLDYHSEFTQLSQALDKLKITEKTLVESAHKAQNLCVKLREDEKNLLSQNISTAKAVIVVISLIAILSGLLIGYIIARAITLPMQTAVQIANAMSTGDFTQSLTLNQKDEVGQFAVALENMRQQLKSLIEILVQSSNSLASGSTELASTTEELSTTIADQTSQVSMVASAVEELSASSSQILNSISAVNQKSESAKDLTFKGQTCIKSANSVMSSIQINVDELGATVSSLARSSEEIGNILLVINDIADQTNLLALNAAIEAARAGEHGRGFAVVADEVRKLAERTQSSIHEIESIISSFVTETTKTNKEMESAKGRVREGVSRLNETNEIFTTIVHSVDEISDSSTMITTAIKEQVSAITNINDNAHVISSGLEQSSAALVQVTATVADLQKQADNQMDSTSIFKI